MIRTWLVLVALVVGFETGGRALGDTGDDPRRSGESRNGPPNRGDRSSRGPDSPVASSSGLTLQSAGGNQPRLDIEPWDGGPRILVQGLPGDVVDLETATEPGAGEWETDAVFELGKFPQYWPAITSDHASRVFRLSRSTYQPRLADDFSLLDLEGRRRHLFYYWPDPKIHAVVLVFTGGELSADDSRIRGLVEIDRDFRDQGVMLWVVSASPSRAELASQARSAGLDSSGPLVLHDAEGIVTRLFGITATPCAVCIDSRSGRVFYRGTVGVGTALEPLTQVLRGRLWGVPGSVLETRITGGTLVQPGPPAPDYATEIVPILRERCVTCHRPGSAAPWAMTHHAVVQEYGRQMRTEILNGHMPPWGADPQFGRFSNDRSLLPAERVKLVTWLSAGAPRGTGADPLADEVFVDPPKWPEDLGEPDLVLRLPEQNIKAQGVEAYRYGDLTMPTDEPVWLRAVLLRPSNGSVTHHLVAYRQRSPSPGYPEIAGFAPGYGPQRFPAGTGRRLEAHLPITVEMHYTPNGVAQVDTPELAMWFHAKPPAREILMNHVENLSIRIAPHDPESLQTAELRLGRAATIYNFIPHLHLRGTSMKFEAVFPDGRSEVLLSVPHYDFHWQNTYTLAEPRSLPSGTTIRATARYDNSALNPLNPNPDGVVWWGPQSNQEMMIGFFDMTWK